MEWSHAPARRLIIAQSWWVASELIRRHPDLSLLETYPGGGQYDCLSVFRNNLREEWKAIVDLNRNGSIHVHVDPTWSPRPWTWLMQQSNAHDGIKRIEHAAGLAMDAKAPPSSGAALAYRLASRLLTSMLNDRHSWDVRHEHGDGDDHGWATDFPTAQSKKRQMRPEDGRFGTPAWRFWAILRDARPVAIIDTDGELHLSDGSVNLQAQYLVSKRSLTMLLANTLGTLLP